MRKTVTVQPSPQSAIYWNDLPVIMTDDAVGGATRMSMHVQDNPQVSWLRSVAPGHSCVLVDIGGNVGLFSRQALIAIPNIVQVFVYEPDKENYAHMLQNLAPWEDRIVSINAALSDATGVADFYYDPDNCGNYSLLRSAMMYNSFSQGKINTINATEESFRWLKQGHSILYKSDTQGYDEILATLIDPKIWDHVFAAILEIWRVEKPAYDVDKFFKILSGFGTRRLSSRAVDLTPDEVISYASGTDGSWLDLELCA